MAAPLTPAGPPRRWQAVAARLPEGSAPVAAGLVVAGLTAYGFLVVSARALSPTRYSALSVLWALLNLVAPGCFFPLEQEVARAVAARRAQSLGGGPVVRRAAAAGAGGAIVLVLICAVVAGPLGRRLFENDGRMVVALAVVLAAYACEHVARGALAGNRRFSSYGLLLGAEGALRLGGCVVLAALHVRGVGPYGLVLAFAPLPAVALALARERGLLDSGPDPSWSELSRSLGYLLAGSLLGQTLVNAGPVAVKVLARSSEKAAAGRFLAGLVVARVPLFFYQAVQASLLPNLARLAAIGDIEGLRSVLRRLLVVVGVIGATASLGALVLGPPIVRLLFGRAFVLGRSDLFGLAVGSSAYMVALTLAQGLLAMGRLRRAALGWLAGIVALAAVTAVTSGLLARVELGFVVGASVAAVTMYLFVASDRSIDRGAVRLGGRSTDELVEP